MSPGDRLDHCTDVRKFDSCSVRIGQNLKCRYPQTHLNAKIDRLSQVREWTPKGMECHFHRSC